MKSIMPFDVTRNGVSIHASEPVQRRCWAQFNLFFSLSLSLAIGWKWRKVMVCENQGKDKKWKLTFPSALFLRFFFTNSSLSCQWAVCMHSNCTIVHVCCISATAPIQRLILNIFHKLIGSSIWIHGKSLLSSFFFVIYSFIFFLFRLVHFHFSCQFISFNRFNSVVHGIYIRRTLLWSHPLSEWNKQFCRLNAFRSTLSHVCVCLCAFRSCHSCYCCYSHWICSSFSTLMQWWLTQQIMLHFLPELRKSTAWNTSTNHHHHHHYRCCDKEIS